MTPLQSEWCVRAKGCASPVCMSAHHGVRLPIVSDHATLAPTTQSETECSKRQERPCKRRTIVGAFIATAIQLWLASCAARFPANQLVVESLSLCARRYLVALPIFFASFVPLLP